MLRSAKKGNGRRDRLIATALMASTVMTAVMASPVVAQQADAQPRQFDIPPQPLGDALMAFGRQSGLQVTAGGEMVEGRNASGVSGRMVAADALSRLLTGTGLTFRFVGANAVRLELAPQSAGSVTVLGPVRVEGQGADAGRSNAPVGEAATGRFEGYVPTRSSTAAKTDTPFLESPQTVAVVGRDQMEDQGIISVSEALRYTSGVQTEMAGGQAGRFDSFFVRGVGGFGSAAQYASYIDGMRWVYPLRTAISIDPYMLERIEVMKGPSSALYGQGSAGGFVNLITKRPSLEAPNEVFVTIGSHNRFEGGFDLNGALDRDQRWLYRVVALGRTAHTGVDFQRDKRVLIAPSLTWQPTDRTSLTLQGMYQRDPQAPDAGFADPMGSLYEVPGFGKVPKSFFQGDPNFNRFRRTQASIGYQFDHRFSDALTFHSNARFGHMESSTRTITNGVSRVNTHGDPSDPFPDQEFTLPNEITRYWYAAEHNADSFAIDNNLTASLNTGAISHTLLAGVDHLRFSGKQVFLSGTGIKGYGECVASRPGVCQSPIIWFGGNRDAWIWDAFNPSYGFDYSDLNAYVAQRLADKDRPPAWNQKLRQTGIYIQDQIALHNWRLTLSGRHDWSKQEDERFAYSVNSTFEWIRNDATDKAFTGRAVLAYASDSGLLPFIGYATSFDPIVIISPSLNTAGSTSIPFTPTVFEPERGSGWEGGLRYQPPGRNLYFSATYFHGTKKKFAMPTGNSSGCNAPYQPTCYTQDTRAKAQGVELEARGEILPGLNIIANYTWIDAEITKTDSSIEMFIQALKDAGFIDGDLKIRPVGVPQHMASFWANYQFRSSALAGLSVGGGARYVGKTAATPENVWVLTGYYSPDDDPYSRLGKPAIVPSRTVFDASISYDLGQAVAALEGASLTVTAANLLDKTYVSSCNGYSCTYGDGRDVRATLRYRW